MSNLKILLKNNINCFIGTMQGKRQRKGTFTALALILLGACGIIALYSFQAFSMFKGLGEKGLDKLCVFHGIITTLTVMLIIGIMRVSATPKSSDADFLLSMPIKRKDIIISKTINKYVFDLFFAITLLAPFLVIYQIRTGFDFLQTVCGISTILLLPLLSVGISYICDFIIVRIFNKNKYSKLLKSLFSVLIFLLIMALMLVKTMSYGTVAVSSMEEYFSDRPLSNLVLKFIFNQNFVGMSVLILITVLPFVFGCFLYSKNFGKSFVGYNGKNEKLSFKTEKNGFKRLFKKELGTYASTPAYITNTIISPIMMIVSAIILATMGIDKVGMLIGINVSKEIFVGFVAVLFAFCCVLANISACSISLEGNQFWIIKSSPINISAMFLAKVLLNVVMVVPSILLSATIVAIAFKVSFLNFVIMCAIPILANLICSFAGLFINLCFPKFDWTEETQVVKQSIAVLLSLIVGALVALIPVGIYLLFKTMNLSLIALICAGIYLVLVGIAVALNFTVGKKLFNKM